MRRGPVLKTAALAALLSFGLEASASAACTIPTPPDPKTRPEPLTPPVKGPCVGAKPGTPGCKGFEDYSFNDEVRAYNAKLPAWKAQAEDYVARLNAFVKASGDYARCEVDILQGKAK